jgi:beta-ureidopropionase / N-carbamoyl-L-amino-acid hydrolase
METLQHAIDAERLWSDLTALAAITDPSRPYTRRSFTPLFLAGRDFLAQRMRDAGLAVRIDAAGNLIGRRDGARRDAPVILIGSHSDTVPDGGRFDGPAGVLAALEVARALEGRGIALAHSLEVIDFLAEEPSEYGLSCVGSRGLAGALGANELALVGPEGEALAAAIVRMGGAPECLDAEQRSDLLAYLELHIEQGTVLEQNRLDVGIVTAIVGISRVEIVFAGEAAHAGTAAMTGRRDAAVTAAKAVLAIRDMAVSFAARGEGYVVATTGIVEISPGAANVVPGQARLVVDLRAQTTALQREVLCGLEASMAAIARSEDVRLARYALLSHNDPAACDARLRRILADSAAALGLGTTEIASGAGHDAAFVSRLAPSSMLFIPCRGGRSHCPEEWSEPGEIAAGAAVLLEAVRRIDSGLLSHDEARP